jgi:hypothetical protein
LGAVVVAAAFAAPTAATAGGDEKPSRRFCSQFVRYSALRETVDQARSVVDDPESDESDRTKAFAMVALSEPLGDAVAAMVRVASNGARARFNDLVDAYRDGAAVLEDAGVSRDQIETLPDEIAALTDVSAGTSRPSLPDVVTGLGIDDAAAFFDAADQFTQSVEDAEDSVLDALPEDVGVQCGVVPSGEFVCDELVSDDEAADVLGTIDETATGAGCAWGSDDEVLAVEVYANGAASFDLLEARLFEAEPVDDLGDEAAVGSGYTSTASGQGGTSGMTMVVRDGRRTVLVSLSLDDTAPEQLTGLVQQVLDNL